MNKKKKL